VHRQLKIIVSSLAALVLTSAVCVAAPKDKSANGMIDKAMNEHYLQTDFKKAEGLLLGTIKACGEECSPAVIARAWMYVGIVRGSGNNDQRGARKAFEKALKTDEEVPLDDAIANANTKKSFEAVAKKLGVEPTLGAETDDAETAPEAASEDGDESEDDEEREQPGVAGSSCGAPDDCNNGLSCVSGQCTQTVIDQPADPAAAAAPSNWIGLHFALDFVPVGGTSVCAAEGGDTETYACFTQPDEAYFYDSVDPAYGGNIDSTIALGTKRLLLSFDHAITSNVSLGARVGYAFGGGPQPASATAFLPWHLEGRLAYWFGAEPFGRSFRPYVHAGGGMAQVDAKVANVQVLRTDGSVAVLDAWRKLGTGFIDAGGGAVIGLTDSVGAQLNLNLMYLLGSSGLVIQPSIGAVFGF
jgi:hypothetical protein